MESDKEENIIEKKEKIEEKEEENKWKILLDDINSNDISKENKEPENLNLNLSGLLLNYFNDYCNISYLEDIKQNDVYLINKWKLLFYHSIELDDYFLKLVKKKINSPPFSFKKKRNRSSQNKNNKSFNVQSKQHLSVDPNSSYSFNSGDKPKKDLKFKNINLSLSSNSQNNEKKDSNISNNTQEENEKNYMDEELDSNLNEFKLKEAKKSLQIYENEIIGGEEFENKSRRILNLMLIFIKNDNYMLSNPDKITIQNFIELLKIKELENIQLTESDNFEIDIVINDFKVSDLNKL